MKKAREIETELGGYVAKTEVVKDLNASHETDKITPGKLHLGASSQIDSSTLKESHLVTGAVSTRVLRDLAVTNAKIKDLSASKITTGYLAAGRIAAGSITSDKLTIANGFIKNAMIADAAITSAKIANLDAAKSPPAPSQPHASVPEVSRLISSPPTRSKWGWLAGQTRSASHLHRSRGMTAHVSMGGSTRVGCTSTTGMRIWGGWVKLVLAVSPTASEASTPI
ncbi:hypothetical protein [Arcanobacterium hippocoleae]|uniref:hypothetical protein n=1 Tax=Arcanobacterium hippocoleae TaxID=149017 RepID=UPI00334078A8